MLGGAIAAAVIAGLGIWHWAEPRPVRVSSVVVPIAASEPVNPAAAPGEAARAQDNILVTPPVAASAVHPAPSTESVLPPAPLEGFYARGQYGFVPVLAPDGRAPWAVYARPFDQNDKRPRIAVILTGLGIGSSATDAAISTTPPEVTLAFAPFARRVGEWMKLARAAGHETLLEMPMEPLDYPRDDPGFNTLLTAYNHAANLDRVDWVMSQAMGYAGLIGQAGSRFSASEDAMSPIVEDIAKHGLIYVDNRSTPQTVVPSLAALYKLRFATVNRAIDADPTPVEVDRKLADLEELAVRNGTAVGLGTATRLTLERLSAWAAGLEAKGLALVPVSAVTTVPSISRPEMPQPVASASPARP